MASTGELLEAEASFFTQRKRSECGRAFSIADSGETGPYGCRQEGLRDTPGRAFTDIQSILLTLAFMALCGSNPLNSWKSTARVSWVSFWGLIGFLRSIRWGRNSTNWACATKPVLRIVLFSKMGRSGQGCPWFFVYRWPRSAVSRQVSITAPKRMLQEDGSACPPPPISGWMTANLRPPVLCHDGGEQRHAFDTREWHSSWLEGTGRWWHSSDDYLWSWRLEPWFIWSVGKERLWCLTYRKGNYKPWPKECFFEVKSTNSGQSGDISSWRTKRKKSVRTFCVERSQTVLW